MQDFDSAFDRYIVRLHRCKTMEQFDMVMEDAAMDSDCPHPYFIRLCLLSKVFMHDLGLPPDST